ncbi:hypothetical protein T4D_13028 [Trichinella pseudospiralis]|uniref:Uncharacterized protein n=1 Tax=Trichinella pseudospiralis TaxID=6337 RepID=A0A0V1DPM8_TRIPS|nr:hypothetical protein T4D_13028 [Trichinella pseudospiralis]
MKTCFLPTNGTLALKILPRETEPLFAYCTSTVLRGGQLFLQSHMINGFDQFVGMWFYKIQQKVAFVESIEVHGLKSLS